MIGTIVPTPVAVSETGYIRIVADNTKQKSQHVKWEYKAVSYDPTKPNKVYGLAFEVTESEVEQWTAKQN